MTSVWLVWSQRGGSHDYEYLEAVCRNETDAKSVAELQREEFDAYHGSAYRAVWLLPLGREYTNQHGDRIWWEERRLWGIAV